MRGESDIYIYPRSLRALQQTLLMCLDHMRSSDNQILRHEKLA